jgi:hypothetical protein
MQSGAISVTDKTIFVMSWRRQYYRYCLEPQDSTGIQERLEAALEHIDESMTEDNLRNTRRPKAARAVFKTSVYCFVRPPGRRWQLPPRY